MNLKFNISTIGIINSTKSVVEVYWPIKALNSFTNMFHETKYQIVPLKAVVGNDWSIKALSMHIKSHIKKTNV